MLRVITGLFSGSHLLYRTPAVYNIIGWLTHFWASSGGESQGHKTQSTGGSVASTTCIMAPGSLQPVGAVAPFTGPIKPRLPDVLRQPCSLALFLPAPGPWQPCRCSCHLLQDTATDVPVLFAGRGWIWGHSCYGGSHCNRRKQMQPAAS